MASRLYTLYKPMRRKLPLARVLWWAVVAGLVFSWWLTLSPASSDARGPRAMPTAFRATP